MRHSLMTTPPAATATDRRKQLLVVARAFIRKYRNDPVAFARDILGVRLWSKQAEILRLAAKHNRVSISSGHKIGKSKAGACLAIWFFVTRPGARVILFAPSFRQINEILWREIKDTLAHAKVKLDVEVFANPDKGIVARDGRQIFGFSTDSQERVAGLSGNILYLLDEASGIPDEVHRVASTNPGGLVVMLSNPTRNAGTFFDSHHQGAIENGGIWATLRVSSEEAAAENTPIPGFPGRYKFKYLANDQWIAERKLEFGEDSPHYDIRVRGIFARQSDRSVIPAEVVDDAAARWSDVPQEGRLTVGADVAGYGSDDTAIIARRGFWTSEPFVVHGYDAVEVANEIRKVCKLYQRRGERPLIRIDASNGYGAGPAAILSRDDDKDVERVEFQSASRDKHYERLRDHAWHVMRDWLRAGGAIAPDPQLKSDLKRPTYDILENGKIKVESKRELKKKGRSPDRADALALAVFDPPRRNDLALLSLGDGMPKTSWT